MENKCSIYNNKKYIEQREWIGRIVIEDRFKNGHWYSIEAFREMFIEEVRKKYNGILYYTEYDGRSGGWAFTHFNDRMKKWLDRQCEKGILNRRKFGRRWFYQNKE